jgi:hypothetical protein
MMSPDSPGLVLSPRVENDRSLLKFFLAGFLSTLVFHTIPRAPFEMRPVPAIGVPAVMSLAFWGGVWGIAIWPLLSHAAGAAYWLRALLIGAVGPSAVALFVVFPLKGMGVASGWDPGLTRRSCTPASSYLGWRNLFATQECLDHWMSSKLVQDPVFAAMACRWIGTRLFKNYPEL